jgi:poly-gamma-glutamate synthesis protein (capsule biosynthesis protein)
VEKQIKNYRTYTKIVLFHWGIEDVHYPLPEQRDIAKKLIDIGIDLIVGNHSHVVQSYEQYKGKWIFYCLGHFFFPDFISHFIRDGEIRTYSDIHSKKRKRSIIPVFDIKGTNVTLSNIYTIVANGRFEPKIVNKKLMSNLFLFKNDPLYKLFYKSYMAKKLLYKLLYYVLPCRIYRILKRQLNRI